MNFVAKLEDKVNCAPVRAYVGLQAAPRLARLAWDGQISRGAAMAMGRVLRHTEALRDARHSLGDTQLTTQKRVP